MSTPVHHHFIPGFYLSQWHDNNFKLIEFTQFRSGRLVTKEVSSKETGFARQLYTALGLSIEKAQVFKADFLRIVDERTSNNLQKMKDFGLSLNIKERFHWAQFILTLLLRTPEELKRLKRLVAIAWLETDCESEIKYQKLRRSSDPITYRKSLDETDSDILERIALRVFLRTSNSEVLMKHIFQMDWGLITFTTGYKLIFSDRTVIMNNGILNENS